MRVFSFNLDRVGFGSITTVREDDLDIFLELEGQPVGQSWREVCVERLAESDFESGLPVGDFPFLSANVPVFSKRAVSLLGSLLVPAVEVLPLSCPSDLGRYYAVNVTNVVDALDERRSRIDRFASTGRVQSVRKYEFRPEPLKGQVIFRIPQTARMEILVGERFVEAVRDSDLQGFSAGLIWSG